MSYKFNTTGSLAVVLILGLVVQPAQGQGLAATLNADKSPVAPQTGLLRTFAGLNGCVCAVAVSPDGEYIVAGGKDAQDGVVCIWERRTGKEVRRFRPNCVTAMRVGFDKDGRYVFCCGDHRLPFQRWEWRSGRVDAQIVEPGEWFIEMIEDAFLWWVYGRSIAMSPEEDAGKRMSEAWLHEMLRPWENGAMAVSCDGGYLLTCTILLDSTREKLRGFTVRLQDLHTRIQKAEFCGTVAGNRQDELTRFIGESEYRPALGLIPPPYGIPWVLSSDGKRALSGGDDSWLRLWELGTGKLLRRFSLQGHKSRAVALSPDGRFALSGVDDLPESQNDFQLLVFDTTAARPLRVLTGHKDMITCVAFSPSGRRILSGSTDRTVRLWDLQSGREVCCFKGNADAVTSIAFSPDGRFAVSSAGPDSYAPNGPYDPVRLWQLPAE